MTNDGREFLPDPRTMPWRVRLAYELIKPRESKVLHAIGMGIASLIVVWGILVCVVITAAVIAAILGV